MSEHPDTWSVSYVTPLGQSSEVYSVSEAAEHLAKELTSLIDITDVKIFHHVTTEWVVNDV